MERYVQRLSGTVFAEGGWRGARTWCARLLVFLDVVSTCSIQSCFISHQLAWVTALRWPQPILQAGGTHSRTPWHSACKRWVLNCAPNPAVVKCRAGKSRSNQACTGDIHQLRKMTTVSCIDTSQGLFQTMPAEGRGISVLGSV